MIFENHEKKFGLDSYIPFEAMYQRNDPEIYNWCRQHTLISPSDQKNWLEKINSDKSIKMFSIVDNEIFGKDKIVGICGFTSIDLIHRKAEFSLYIYPEHQNKGYGKRALNILIRHGFMDWGFNRIWGETFEHNHALNMFLDLGFKKEGIIREAYYKGGRFIDAYIVSILRGEFE